MKRFAFIAAIIAAVMMCASCEEKTVQEETVAEFRYKDSLSWWFYCTNPYSPELIIPRDENAKWIVGAYWPKRRTHYRIQFARLKDAEDFIKKYKALVDELPNDPSKITRDILEQTSLEISSLMRDYVLEEDNRHGLDNWDDENTGERSRVALPVYKAKK